MTSVTIYNVSGQMLPPDHSSLAVRPGDGVELDLERALELLGTPDWSRVNPRQRPPRKANTQPATPDQPIEPAESGDQQETP